MNKLAIITILFLSFSGLLSAQPGKPTMDFSHKEHNFGNIRETDGSVSYDFAFSNRGTVPLIINDVKSSCGCTTPQWPKEPVLPGSKGIITVKFEPKGRPGVFEKSINIISNADIPMTTLTITGVVIPVNAPEQPNKFSIGELGLETIYVSFGELFTGSVDTSYIKVFNNSTDKPISLTFQNVPAYLSIRVFPEIFQPQQEAKIRMIYNTTLQKDWDYVIDRLPVLVNGVALPNNRINITANIKEDFSKLTAEDLINAPVAKFDSVSFDFGTISDTQTIEHEFTLNNTGKSDLIIRKVTASCGCTAVKQTSNIVHPGTQTTIKAVFNPAGKSGNQKKAITVITNDPKRSRIILWITGKIE